MQMDMIARITEYCVRKDIISSNDAEWFSYGLVQRSEKLITLGEKMKNDFIEACEDQEQIVLIEEEAEINGTKYMTGHSKNYIRCAFESDGLVPNMVIKGTINSKLNEEFVFCKRID